MLKKIIFLIAIFFSINMAHADDCGDDPCDPDIPIDGGVSLLIAAGVAYGGKKIADSRKAKKELKTED